ncbi:MAG: M81 family metallopeptidase [Anaerolineae bacterium]
MRLAVGGLMHETNTFSTLPTTYDDFTVVHGESLLKAPVWRDAKAAGHELHPLFVAHATPSGRVTKSCFERFLKELLEGLKRSLPLDGVLLQLHGAMEVEGVGDGETAILEGVRALVGPTPQIAVALDLHANLAPAVVAQSDLITAYRTAPHRDAEETVARAAHLLFHCLQHGIRPHTYLVQLPLLVAGEAAVTEVEPAKTLFERLPALDRLSGILVSSILIGCAWTDSPHTRVSTVVSGTEPRAVREAALDLAQDVWKARSRFAIDAPTADIDTAIRMAHERPERPVFISDAGDNPTAGAAGDSPIFLRHLVAAGVEDALVAGIADPDAVARCFAHGPGSNLVLSIGGKLDRTFAQPFETQVRVKGLVPETDGIPPRALVQIGGVEVVLQSNRRPFTTLHHFESMGLDINAKKVIVVKLGYLFPELRDTAPYHIMGLSPGFGDQRLRRLPYRSLSRPIYPLDPGAQWHSPARSTP